jgi:hypothetical protein
MQKQINNLYLFLKHYNIEPNQFEIIISRYNENIDHWFPLKEYITIYNKGENLNLESNIRIINIPNVGRESHTYLYHIINNFAQLKYLNLFIQADFSDHLNEIYDLTQYLIRVNNIKINLKNKNTTCFNGWGRLQHQPQYLQMIYKNQMKLSKYSFGEWWLKYISNKLPNLKDFKWGPCGIFSVKGKTIINKDINYYKNIMSSIEEHSNPEEGHYCERSWYYIFG